MNSIDIITIGDELTEGRLIDSNAGHLSEQLSLYGLYVVRHTSVGDDRGQIAAILQEAAARSQAVIVTGGLGPTTDDLTAEVAASAFGLPLSQNPAALAHVEAYFASRGRPMSPNNVKQADLPAGSELLPNPWGTAVGFKLTVGACRLYFMPGVPAEMKRIFQASVLPDLQGFLPTSPSHVAQLRVFGTGESNVGHLLEGLEDSLEDPSALVIQYRASFPEIQVRLLLRGGGAANLKRLEVLRDEAAGRLSKFLISERIGATAPSLAEVVLQDARSCGATLSVAESCTGGLIGAMLTDVAGSSDVFLGGVISYADQVKVTQLGVDNRTLAAHGAVSAEVAEAMAAGARLATGASHGLSVTGIAGPGGARADKPVGTVWIGVATPDQVTSRHFHFPFERERNRKVSAFSALALLRKSLIKAL